MPTTDARLAKAAERIQRNLASTAYPWTRHLSTLFGVHPDLALAALRGLVEAGIVDERLAAGKHEYRLA